MDMKHYISNSFSWVIENKLAGMPFPGIYESGESDIDLLKEKKISLLVSLTLKTPDPNILKNGGIKSKHFPVIDFQAPTTQQLYDFSVLTEKEISNGGRVAVHCYAGKGRTGTFLAAYFVFKGTSPDDAIHKIRTLRKGSIETKEQEESVKKFYEYLKSLQKNRKKIK